ncbi:hypothetical protein BRD17_01200 [Halobacteriales archaeon SW_7_68_16]|nr:MAG: hypothetical protein BRD17_01200 [Halobacteriales archaeon SW_7_68_16]
MGLSDFIGKWRARYHEDGAGALPGAVADLTTGALARVPGVTRLGTTVYDRDWDVLLILDACRWDMYDEVVGRGERIWSVGASSPEWMTNTFRERYADAVAATAYVTGNPFSETHVDRARLGAVDEVWRYGWDDALGTIPPDPITDRVIATARSGEYDHVIGHYMQPHYPFVGDDSGTDAGIDLDRFGDEAADGTGGDRTYWQRVADGEIDLETLWTGYHDNLRLALEAVETVTDNVDGRVAITADHGNAVGEWGYWGHEPNLLHPKMRWVPWEVREATDTETYVPTLEPGDEGTIDRESRLDLLGYR